MSGHSKWSNIQGRKNAQDTKRGKIFQKISKEIFVAAKSGGDDATSNPALRLALDKAKRNNMPNDNIQRAIKKATSSEDTEHYEEVTYEGYGPNGVAILVHALTDNRNRTATNVRVLFNKNGGALGETGSVSYLFERKGYLEINRQSLDMTEEAFLLLVLDLGAEDLEISDDMFCVYTDGASFTAVRGGLEAQGFHLEHSELTMVPQTTVALNQREAQKVQNLVGKLEEDEDVSAVFTSLAVKEEE